ncbi:MAG: chromosomal replication initiator protein DnaA, partial [Proteobacteria bacterium]|nr:chromosomal replication initiator protein DnaA [Pseudomonadota bacterium]
RGGSWNYNSLLMLAHTGLGKSHLSQAAGHAVLEGNVDSRVYYLTAEDFTNEMIYSLKNNSIEGFKDKYRRCCDVLIMEEVHFLSGKEKIQAELGFTLDALANDNKKIIFTSSLLPKDIPRMSKELSSRLGSGLVTSITPPDYETRVKILTNKASEHDIVLSEAIIDLLASRLKRDVRQMESALKCLKARSELLKVKIDFDLAEEVVNSLVPRVTEVGLGEIKDLVCKYYKVGPEIFRSKSRKKIHSYPRNIYVYLCRRFTDETLEKIARTINRSHSTALYSAELIESKMKSNAAMRRQVDFFSRQIENK